MRQFYTGSGGTAVRTAGRVPISPAAPAGLFLNIDFTDAQGFTADWNACPSGSVSGTVCSGGWDITPKASVGNGTDINHDEYNNFIGASSNWTATSNQFGAQILTTDGPFGTQRVLRQTMDPGDDDGDPGLTFSFPSTYTELWFRWYQRWSPGFGWDYAAGPNPGHYRKNLYFNVGLTGFHIVQNHGNPSGWGMNYNGGPNYMSPTIDFTDTGDGNWHYSEVHIKLGTSTGEYHLWFDDPVTPVLTQTGLNIGTAAIEKVLVGSNQYWPLASGWTEFCKIAASSSGQIGVAS